MKHQARQEEKALDEFCREVVRAARADEDVINAAADSPFLFQRVRAQVAELPERQVRRGFFAWFVDGRRLRRWTTAATALAAALALIALMQWPGEVSPPAFPLVADSVRRAAASPALEGAAMIERMDKSKASGRAIKAISTAVRRADRQEREVTTEYMPLTYVASTDEAESGQVVRVQVPRAALVAMGVRVSSEPSAELVKADVIVGDDGLARAIRLVR